MRRDVVFIVFLQLLFSEIVISQEVGLPYLRNYSIQDYNASASNWAIVQDKRNITYIGNTDGVLEYDGVNFTLIPIANKSNVRSLALDKSGRVYCGCFGEFGYLETNNYGKTVYISLSNLIPENENKFLDVWDIHFLNDTVIFRTFKKLLCFYNNKISVINSENSLLSSSVLNGKLYVVIQNIGLCQLTQRGMSLVKQGNYFQNIQTQWIIPFSQNEILLSNLKENKLYIYNSNQKENSIRVFPFGYHQLFKGLYYTANSLNSENFVIGTQGSGAFMMNRKGELLKTISDNEGLQNKDIKSIYTDSEQNIWFALNNGFSYYQQSSPITIFNKSNGLDNVISEIVRFKNTIYIATQSNVLYIKNNKLAVIPNSNDRNRALFEFVEPQAPANKHLLLANSKGLFEIDNFQIKTILSSEKLTTRGILKIAQSTINPNRVFLCLYEGLASVLFENGQWKLEGKYNGVNDDIRSCIEDSLGNLWLGSFRNGVYKLTPTKELLEPQVKHYTLEHGFKSLKNILSYSFKDRVIFGTETGLFKYNKSIDRFEPDCTFGTQFCDGSHDVFSFYPLKSGDVWIAGLNQKHGSTGLLKDNGKGGYDFFYQPFNAIPPMMVLGNFAEEDGTSWVGGSEGLYKYTPNSKFSFSQPYNALIRKTSIGKDSTIFGGNFYKDSAGIRIATANQQPNQIPELLYKYNSISISYCATCYISENKTVYQYYLEGFEDTWSDWTNRTIKEYTNLPEGEYRFRVRAKNIYDTISREAFYEFIILTPWYKSVWAYLIYILWSIMLIYIIVYFNGKRLKYANVQLEQLIKERTKELSESNTQLEEHQAELEIKQEEISAQAELLARTNIELEKLSIAASKTDNAIVIMDAETNFDWVNEGFKRLYGTDLTELINERGKSLLLASKNDDIGEIIKDCLEKKTSVHYQTYNTLKSGESFWVQTTLTPIISADGEILKLIAIGTNITKLMEAEQEIIMQNAELEAHRTNLEMIVTERTAELEIAKNKAQESERLKTAFLANMSHEIRTPMNAIIGFSSLLSSKYLEENEREELVEYIQANSNTLLQLIDDIIDLSKIETGQLSISIKPFNLNRVLDELLETFNYKKNHNSNSEVELKLSFGVNGSEFEIHADSLRIQQLLSNLVDNALKFTEKGTIEFGYELQSEEKIKFFVMDTGIGMSESQQKQIFNRFTKIEEDKTKLYRGAGLGLTICKNIATLMGGNIFVESLVNKGTTISFTIPLIRGSERLDSLELDENYNLTYNWSNKSVLIAEDEDGNYKYLEKLLRSTKIKVFRANNGIEAADLFTKYNPDIILMDIKMPIMDGIEATKEIRKSSTEIPIVALSAYAFNHEVDDIKKEGFNDYLSKPTTPSKILSLLSRYLNQSVTSDFQ